MTPDELPADMEDLVAFVDQQNTVLLDREVPNLKASIRALLKAYQEQRRALERMQLESDPIKLRAIARAALNQKGDER